MITSIILIETFLRTIILSKNILQLKKIKMF